MSEYGRKVGQGSYEEGFPGAVPFSSMRKYLLSSGLLSCRHCVLARKMYLMHLWLQESYPIQTLQQPCLRFLKKIYRCALTPSLTHRV